MKAKLALIAAIALGIVAAVGVHRLLQTQQEEVREQLQLTTVVAYGRRLERGSVLAPESLMFRDVPSAALTPSTVVERDIRRLFGQRLVRDVETNQVVQWDDFEEQRVGLPEPDSGLRPGQRAVTVGVDSVAGVAGNIRPGSHVDIFGTFQVPVDGARPGERAMMTKTVLLLSDVPVLATDDRTTLTQHALAGRRQGGGYSTVTVAATPQESLMLVYAQQSGRVTFALRSDGDVLPTGEMPGLTERELISFAERLEEERRQRLQTRASERDGQ